MQPNKHLALLILSFRDCLYTYFQGEVICFSELNLVVALMCLSRWGHRWLKNIPSQLLKHIGATTREGNSYYHKCYARDCIPRFVKLYLVLQVNLRQKLLFLHQLTHNMTKDCSLFMKIVGSEYLQNML